MPKRKILPLVPKGGVKKRKRKGKKRKRKGKKRKRKGKRSTFIFIKKKEKKINKIALFEAFTSI